MIVYKIQRIDKGKTYEIAIFKHKDTDEYSFINLTKGHICPCKFKSYEAAIEELDSQPNVKVLDFRHISPEGFFESELRSHIIGSVVTQNHMYYSPIEEGVFGPAVAESQAQQDLIKQLVKKNLRRRFC